jgi:hypothetical protein
MIPRPEIESLKGHEVKVEFRTSNKKISRTIRGTLKSIGIRNLHIERLKGAGREYKIPLRSVSKVTEVRA